MQIHISRDGQSYGPYTPAQINEMLQNGEVALSDSVWIQSTEWEKVTALAGILGSRAEQSSGVITSSSGRLSSPQTISHRIRHEVEEEGTDNLMRNALGL
ncbi:GYF domain-containing protein [Verrucomicrobiota bacterium sgz303538]